MIIEHKNVRKIKRAKVDKYLQISVTVHPTNIYSFRFNNSNTRKSVKYVQS